MGRTASILVLVLTVALVIVIPDAHASSAKTCKGVGLANGGATSSIRARGVSCHKARRVARAWLRAGCSTGGQLCHVDGYDCRSHQNSTGAVLTTCRQRRKRIHFSSD